MAHQLGDLNDVDAGIGKPGPKDVVEHERTGLDEVSSLSRRRS
jgi:hypothetical protein